MLPLGERREGGGNMRSRERIGNALTFRLHRRCWRRINARSPRWRSHAGREGESDKNENREKEGFAPLF